MKMKIDVVFCLVLKNSFNILKIMSLLRGLIEIDINYNCKYKLMS